ncbi:MAG: hypothetical protein SFV54_29045 [Bryobacteraceae bacterium]|nr:hypothetical protein [Bryobacteraceae bacterium]
MKLLIQLGLFAALACTALAQPNEVEAVRGQCQTATVVAGNGTIQNCILIPLTGGAGLPKVPAGKVLVIEDVTVRCVKGVNDTLEYVSLVAFPYYREVMPELRGTKAGKHVMGGSSLTRVYAGPNTDVKFAVEFINNVTEQANCFMSFMGHYANAK